MDQLPTYFINVAGLPTPLVRMIQSSVDLLRKVPFRNVQNQNRPYLNQIPLPRWKGQIRGGLDRDAIYEQLR